MSKLLIYHLFIYLFIKAKNFISAKEFYLFIKAKNFILIDKCSLCYCIFTVFLYCISMKAIFLWKTKQ